LGVVRDRRNHKYSGKVRFGDAPRLDGEYGATVTAIEGCNEDSVGAVGKGTFIYQLQGR
jgi:hypothetical protein